MNRREILRLLPIGAVLSGIPAFAQQSMQHSAVSPTDNLKPVYIAPGEGEKYVTAIGELTFKLEKAQTMGNLSSHESLLNPGYLAAPPHFHKNFDEICYILEGTLTVLSGEEVVEVPTGGWHFRPRGIVHTFWNGGKVPCRSIQLFTPAGFEDYLKGMLKLTVNNPHPDRDAIRALAQQYDVVVRHDLTQGIIEKYGVKL